MSKYDVFISYSRRDTAIADKICSTLDNAGISYFIDRKGIGGGLEFPEVLADAIYESSLFLYLASRNSYESKFTNSEIIFAFNEKPKNSILPYIIDDSEMPRSMRFTFAGINWRNIHDHPIETALVHDLLELLSRNDHDSSRKTPALQQQPIPESAHTPHNLDLAVKRGNSILYFDKTNWNKYVSPDDEKLGVVIIDGGQRFILGLEDIEDGIEMSWADAMNKYGDCLPDKSQGEAWIKQVYPVEEAIAAYGGQSPRSGKYGNGSDRYWTKTKFFSSRAYIVDLCYNEIGTSSIEEGKIKLFICHRLRRVTPL